MATYPIKYVTFLAKVTPLNKEDINKKYMRLKYRADSIKQLAALLTADRITRMFMNHRRTLGEVCARVNLFQYIIINVQKQCFCCGLFNLNCYCLSAFCLRPGVLFVYDILVDIYWEKGVLRSLSAYAVVCLMSSWLSVFLFHLVSWAG